MNISSWRMAVVAFLILACAPGIALASSQSNAGITSIMALGDPGTLADGEYHTWLVTDAGDSQGLH